MSPWIWLTRSWIAQVNGHGGSGGGFSAKSGQAKFELFLSRFPLTSTLRFR
jgi:hypothetical protein